MEGAYELAVQHGQAGYYAVVRLEVKLVSFFQGARVTYADAANPWNAAVEFGVGYGHGRGRVSDALVNTACADGQARRSARS